MAGFPDSIEVRGANNLEIGVSLHSRLCATPSGNDEKKD